MRFTASEAELCSENEQNKKRIHDGLVKPCVGLLQPLEGSKTLEGGSRSKRKNFSVTKISHCS